MFSKSIYYFLFLSALFIMNSCSNDFQVTEGVTATPVIYGVLNNSDTAIYIRVEKAFVDENTSSIELAKDPSNFYYENISVVLIAPNGVTFNLTRVDGNLEGYPRQDGVFTQFPNYLYKIKQSQLNLTGESEYRIQVKDESGAILANAKTTTLRPLLNTDITSPNATGVLSFLGYNSDIAFAFRSTERAYLHDILITINYTEEKSGQITQKSIEWPLVSNLEQNSNNVISYRVKGRSFFDFMKANLVADPNVNRYMRNASLKITSGGVELRNYTSILKANLGITSSGEIPSYTNIENGVGVFSAKTTFTRENINFANGTLDSLRNGVITKDLNFK